MKTKKKKPSTYTIEGQFLGFIPKPRAEHKYIQVQVGERIISIKLAKKIRKTLIQTLVEGDWLSILLEEKKSGGLSKLNLKSDQVTILANKDKTITSEPIPIPSSSNKKEQILLCSKSSCAKQGGQEISVILTQALEQLGLDKRVNIKLTGCQKQCKKAPSVILMPGKVKHNHIHLKDITSLLKDHYLSS